MVVNFLLLELKLVAVTPITRVLDRYFLTRYHFHLPVIEILPKVIKSTATIYLDSKIITSTSASVTTLRLSLAQSFSVGILWVGF